MHRLPRTLPALTLATLAAIAALAPATGAAAAEPEPAEATEATEPTEPTEPAEPAEPTAEPDGPTRLCIRLTIHNGRVERLIGVDEECDGPGDGQAGDDDGQAPEDGNEPSADEPAEEPEAEPWPCGWERPEDAPAPFTYRTDGVSFFRQLEAWWNGWAAALDDCEGLGRVTVMGGDGTATTPAASRP